MRNLKILLIALLAGLHAGFTTAAQPDAIDDNAVSERILQAFQEDTLYEDALVLVASERGFVLLAGQVLSQEARDKATNIAAFAGRDIRRIINELQVVESLNENTADTDAALADTIRQELRSDHPEPAEKVRVVVHRSVVYLMGALTSEQVNEVATFVSRIPGVAEIKTAFEFIPE